MDESPSFAKSDRHPVILLGLGFTTRRLARRLLFRNLNVLGVSRNPGRFADLARLGLTLSEFSADGLPQGATVVHTIPPLSGKDAEGLHELISGLHPRRVIYISSTGVYGNRERVDAETPVDATGAKASARIKEESWIASGNWRSLIIRPAAIYGPGRGVHCRIARGEPTRSSGAGLVSRIHVDDLAAVLEAGVEAELQGAWPLADDRPSSSDEINLWCASLLGMPLLAGEEKSVTGRKVDGRALRNELGVRIAYPDFEAGILASLAAERAGKA